MPTFKHGKNADFSLDGSAATLVNISDTLDSINMPRAIDTAETTAFGTQDKTFITGLSGATISLAGMFDATVDGHISTAITQLKSGSFTSLTFQYGPSGSASGLPKFTGEVLITGYDLASPVADKVTYSLELQVTGAITQSTYS